MRLSTAILLYLSTAILLYPSFVTGLHLAAEPAVEAVWVIRAVYLD